MRRQLHSNAPHPAAGEGATLENIIFIQGAVDNRNLHIASFFPLCVQVHWACSIVTKRMFVITVIFLQCENLVAQSNLTNSAEYVCMVKLSIHAC